VFKIRHLEQKVNVHWGETLFTLSVRTYVFAAPHHVRTAMHHRQNSVKKASIWRSQVKTASIHRQNELRWYTTYRIRKNIACSHPESFRFLRGPCMLHRTMGSKGHTAPHHPLKPTIHATILQYRLLTRNILSSL